jgi:hypothetical protein
VCVCVCVCVCVWEVLCSFELCCGFLWPHVVHVHQHLSLLLLPHAGQSKLLLPLLLQRVRSGGHSRAPEAPPSGGSSSSRRPRPVYPRIDPAVIVAVRCGGSSCLLAGLVS